MSLVSIIGGMIGDTLDGVTATGRAALADAEVVVFPGDWIGPHLAEHLGDRLTAGRQLRARDVLGLARDVVHIAVLYGGDPLMFTGRPGEFPTALELATELEREGHETAWYHGVSTVQAALVHAGVELRTSDLDSLTIAAPLSRPTGGKKELTRLAQSDALLALLWAEDRAEEAWSILAENRGLRCSACIVSGLGLPNQSVERGSLEELRRSFRSLSAPAVILVEAATIVLPDRLVDVAREWLDRHDSRIIWIVGPPGAGKSTWLRALGAASSKVRCVELGRSIQALVESTGMRPGGLQALGHAARAVRDLARRDQGHTYIVATTGVPDWALPDSDDESLFLLIPERSRIARQRTARPARTAPAADDREFEVHLNRALGLERRSGRRRLDIPFFQELVGMPSP